jgi:septum formation protein
MAKVILASASPRRIELLKCICPQFDVQPADIDEQPYSNEKPETLVARLAFEKANTVLSIHPNATVIGSDTIIAFENKAMGKPSDKADFLNMMQTLSGKTHQVLTSVSCLSGDKRIDKLVSSRIEFAVVSLNEAQKYWQTGEPRDKAGGYAIQGIGAQFVKRINGSYSAVVGLPLYETKQMLETLS